MAFFKKTLVFLIIIALLIPLSSLFSSAKEIGISNISAKSACLIDAESEKVIYSKNRNQRMPMASTTKIMTAIIAIESGIPLDKIIRITQESVGIEGSSIYLKLNEEVSFATLLYALLLSSANDAAVAIAYAVCKSVSNFVNLMNEKSNALGLKDTHFTNPHGLYDENHYTTAEDLAKIMAYAMKNEVFLQITSTYQKTFPRDNQTSFLLTNHNRLLKTYDGIIGGKTGYTKKSGRCLVTCAEREGLRLIAVTLNAPNDWNDHTNLYNFGFSQYERVNFDAQTLKIPVISGNKTEIWAYSEPFSMIFAKTHGDITIKINAPRFLFAKVTMGEKVGEVLYLHKGKIIATSPLYALENVAKIKYKFNLFEWLRDLFKGIFD